MHARADQFCQGVLLVAVLLTISLAAASRGARCGVFERLTQQIFSCGASQTVDGFIIVIAPANKQAVRLLES